MAAADEFPTYQTELARALGGRKPIEAMAEALVVIRSIVEGATDDELTATPAGEDWSPRDVLWHLADVEMVWGIRVRMILTQDRPQLTDVDQDSWVRRFGSLEPDPRRIFETWRAVREANLTIYDSVTGSEFLRVGLHDEWGELSIHTILMMQSGHSLMHAQQLQEALRA